MFKQLFRRLLGPKRRITEYKKRTCFYLRYYPPGLDRSKSIGQKFGAIAIGLDGKKIVITGAATAREDMQTDSYSSKKSLGIAFNRLAFASNPKTRQVRLPIQAAKELTFKQVMVELGLFNNSIVAGLLSNTDTEAFYTKVLQREIDRVTLPPLKPDNVLEALKRQREAIDERIAERKKELSAARKKAS